MEREKEKEHGECIALQILRSAFIGMFMGVPCFIAAIAVLF